MLSGGASTRRRALLLTVPVCLAYAAGALVGWGSVDVARIMGDFGLSAAALAAAVSCGVHALRGRGRTRLSWGLFAGSAVMVAMGNGIWGWYEVVLHETVPTPSAADWCFLFFAPPAIIGLLLVAQRPRGLAGWTCVVLDAWLVGGSLFTLGWTVALARTADGDRADALRIALTLAYPVMDILLVSMVLGLRFRAGRGDRAALNVAVIALALTVISDAVWTTPGIHGGYRSGELLDSGWFSGSLLLAAAPWVGGDGGSPLLPGRAHAATHHRQLSMLSALTPYIAAAVCTAGVVAGAVTGRPPDPVVLVAGGSVLLVLVLRQGITLVDNVFMAQELAAQERHFRSVVQGSSDVIMIAGRDGQLTYVSHAVRRVYGFEPEELVGTRLDLLIHPDDEARVGSELAAFLDCNDDTAMTRVQYRVRSAQGVWLHTESAVNRYGDGIILNSRDVSDRVRIQARLEHDAFHDRLTGLPNRALFEDRIQHALAQRGHAPTVAVLFLDLDGFKAVNDRNGHAVGDQLLQQAARRLEHAVRAGDTVARFGGDEFAALLTGDASPGAIHEIAERLLTTLGAPYRISGLDVRVGASIGIAFASPGLEPSTLMRNADFAMYRAKSRGKGRIEVYRPAFKGAKGAEAPVAADHRRALRERRGETRADIRYAPVVDLADGRVRDVGALAVPRDPATSLTRRLIEDATSEAAAWRSGGLDVGVGVTVPALDLLDGTLPDAVDAALRRAGLPASALCLDITDLRGHDATAVDAVVDSTRALKSLGVRLSLAGFGARHTSSALLSRLFVDALSIDAAFTARVGTDPQVTALTSTIVRVGLDHGLTLTATGVDSAEQADLLRQMGCHRGTGGLYAPPLDATGVARMLRQAPHPGIPAQAPVPPLSPR